MINGEVEPSGAFDACLRLLRAQGDEEKFAGLLLVTKVAQSDTAHLNRVSDALDMRFITRLLQADGDGEQSAVFRGIALNILSAFCAADASLAAKYMPLLPHVLSAARLQVATVHAGVEESDGASASVSSSASACTSAASARNRESQQQQARETTEGTSRHNLIEFCVDFGAFLGSALCDDDGDTGGSAVGRDGEAESEAEGGGRGCGRSWLRMELRRIGPPALGTLLRVIVAASKLRQTVQTVRVSGAGAGTCTGTGRGGAPTAAAVEKAAVASVSSRTAGATATTASPSTPAVSATICQRLAAVIGTCASAALCALERTSHQAPLGICLDPCPEELTPGKESVGSSAASAAASAPCIALDPGDASLLLELFCTDANADIGREGDNVDAGQPSGSAQAHAPPEYTLGLMLAWLLGAAGDYGYTACPDTHERLSTSGAGKATVSQPDWEAWMHQQSEPRAAQLRGRLLGLLARCGVAGDGRWSSSRSIGASGDLSVDAVELRERTLCCAALLVQRCGCGWLVGPSTDAELGDSYHREDSSGNHACELLTLLTRLMAVEIKLVLDALIIARDQARTNLPAAPPLSSSLPPSPLPGEAGMRIDVASQRAIRVVPPLLDGVESVLLFLASAMDSDSDSDVDGATCNNAGDHERVAGSRTQRHVAKSVPAQVLLQLRDALHDTFDAIVQFVAAARDFDLSLATRQLRDMPGSATTTLLLRHVAQLLSVWLCEEGDSCRAKVAPFRAFLLALELPPAVVARLRAVLPSV